MAADAAGSVLAPLSREQYQRFVSPKAILQESAGCCAQTAGLSRSGSCGAAAGLVLAARRRLDDLVLVAVVVVMVMSG
jgi:hypothetical protein